MMKMNEKKFQEVLEIVKGAVDGVSESILEDYIDSDWPNAEEHQEWLESASAREIADWAIVGLRDAMETIE